MSKMSQKAAEQAENLDLDLQEAKAHVKDAYEFLEKIEANTWCRKTQGEIQSYLRLVGYWPAANKPVEEPQL